MPQYNSGWTRRRFVSHAASGALSLTLSRNSPALETDHSASARGNPIQEVRVGTPSVIPNNFGDTWAVAWGDDDNLYSPSNDTLGFDVPSFMTKEMVKLYQDDFAAFARRLTADQKRQFQFRSGPILFNRIRGTDPLNLHGDTVNRMEDYSRQDQWDTMFSANPKPAEDGRSWKSSGCTCVDGVLYWTVARHAYPQNTWQIGLRQSAANASLVKSTDFGRTWTRSAQENLQSPMFPGSGFATPYLIDYGRTSEAVDGSDRYIYAISNNGFWDNGDSLILGRVERQQIHLLDGAHWEFLTNSNDRSNQSWTSDVTTTTPILSRPGKLGETGAVYLPARQRYMMIGWYYPAGSGYLKGASRTTVWDFYEAPKPWGPWTLVHSHNWSPEGYYCPSICPKFQSANRVYVLTAGDFNNWWDFYRATVVPIDLV